MKRTKYISKSRFRLLSEVFVLTQGVGRGDVGAHRWISPTQIVGGDD